MFFAVFCCLFLLTNSQLPPEADDWDLENENPKYFNETCNNDSDCYGSESGICRNGVCNCRDSFEPGLRFVGKDGVQFVCIRAPFVYEPCRETCQKPATCKLSENKTITYKLQYSNQETTIKVSGKICMCQSPYVYDSSSRACVLECKDETEKYDDKSFKCVIDLEKKKSKSINEVQINGSFKPMVAIGEKCADDGQCQNSFSECKNEICSCYENFTLTDGRCVPQSKKCCFNCPYGKVLKKDEKLVSCKTFKVAPKCPECGRKSDENSPVIWSGDTVTYIPPGGLPYSLFSDTRQISHDCPSDYFCSTIYEVPNHDGSHGYCCPNVPLACPMGEPLTNVTCDQLFGETDEQYCPKTHYCHYVYGNSFQPKLCCPRPCYSGFVYVNGHCYQEVNVDYNCSFDEQCLGSSKCIEGTCQCPKHSKKLYHKCFPNDEELSLLKLGDSCKSDTGRCPARAVCNKNYKCVCQSGTYPVGDECVRITEQCPGVVIDKTVAERPYKIDAQDFMQNLTFCKIKNIKPSSFLTNVVEKCSAGYYCKEYMDSAGLCCPLSAARCDDVTYIKRQEPVKNQTCDFQNDNSCGEGYICTAGSERYSNADKDSLDGTFCCPIWTVEDLLGKGNKP